MLGKCWVALPGILKLSDKVTLTRALTLGRSQCFSIGFHRYHFLKCTYNFKKTLVLCFFKKFTYPTLPQNSSFVASEIQSFYPIRSPGGIITQPMTRTYYATPAMRNPADWGTVVSVHVHVPSSRAGVHALHLASALITTI